MNTEPNNKNLRKAITDSLAPAALSDMSDADIEQLLNDVTATPMSDATFSRILNQTNPAHPSDRTVRVPRGIHARGVPPGSSQEIAMSMSNPNRRPGNGMHRGSVAALLVSALCLAVVLIVPARPRLKTADQPTKTFGDAVADVWRTQPLVPQMSAVIEQYAKVAIGEIVETKDRERRRFSLPDGSVLFMNENTTAKVESLRQLKLMSGEVFVEVCPKFDAQEKREFFYVNTPNRKLTAIGTKFSVNANESNTDLMVTQGKVKVDGIDETITAGRFVRFKEDEVKLSMAQELPKS